MFWACSNLRRRFGIKPVQRKRFQKVDKISPGPGAGAPKRVGRGIVYQFSVAVVSWQMTGGDGGQSSRGGIYTPLGQWLRRISSKRMKEPQGTFANIALVDIQFMFPSDFLTQSSKYLFVFC